MKNIGSLLTAALTISWQALPDVRNRWRDASWKVEGKFPNSMMFWAVQREGNTDLLLRSLEQEIATGAQSKTREDVLVATHLLALSTYWIGGCYEIMAVFKRRRISLTPEFLSLFDDFELVRVALEKHEIGKDRDILRPIELMRVPARPDDSPHIYDPKDQLRGHIMPSGVTPRGSLTWLVIDGRNLNQRWIERRSLSDRLLDLWSPNEQNAAAR